MPYECSDCGYGMTRQDYDAATGQQSMFGSKKSASVPDHWGPDEIVPDGFDDLDLHVFVG